MYSSATAQKANERSFFRVTLAPYNAGGKCSCGEWSDKGIPCSHAMQVLAVANKDAGRLGCGLDVLDLVYPAYRLDAYASSYRLPVSLGHLTREELRKDPDMLPPALYKRPVSVSSICRWSLQLTLGSSAGDLERRGIRRGMRAEQVAGVGVLE